MSHPSIADHVATGARPATIAIQTQRAAALEPTTAAATARPHWTDEQYRMAVTAFVARRQWSTNRLAADLALPEATVAAWLGGELATVKLRLRLSRFVAAWNIARPAAGAPESVPDPTADADAPPAARTGRGPMPEAAPAITGGASPFPAGFTVARVNQLDRVGGPAIQIRIGKPPYLNRPLRRELGDPTHVLLATTAEEGQAGTRLRLALAPATPGTPGATRVNSAGYPSRQLVGMVRALPDGAYPVRDAGGYWVTDWIPARPDGGAA